MVRGSEGRNSAKIQYIIQGMSQISVAGRASGRAAAAVLVVVALTLTMAGCGGRSLFGKHYEYEEDLYLSLDGSAEIIVNASVAALVVLRGLDTLPLDPAARIDRDHVRDLFTSPHGEVIRVSRWRRFGRQFVQVRLRVPDIRVLPNSAPFSWSTYTLTEQNGEAIFTQTVGPSAMRPGTLPSVGWQGGELAAFKIHLPSRISYHNARDIDTDEPSAIARGNILAWEQLLTDRLDGTPIEIEVRMDRQSIFHRTLWLFAGSFAAAVVLLASIVWWTMRRGATETPS